MATLRERARSTIETRNAEQLTLARRVEDLETELETTRRKIVALEIANDRLLKIKLLFVTARTDRPAYGRGESSNESKRKNALKYERRSKVVPSSARW
jgi:hypothetical protein